jgi:hypothetical protein
MARAFFSDDCEKMLPGGHEELRKTIKNAIKSVVLEEEYYFFFGAAFFAGAFFVAGFLAAAFFAAAIGIHLLPERVIFSSNLAINKYFGRNGVLRHRITINHHFFL